MRPIEENRGCFRKPLPVRAGWWLALELRVRAAIRSTWNSATAMHAPESRLDCDIADSGAEFIPMGTINLTASCRCWTGTSANGFWPVLRSRSKRRPRQDSYH